ncbi:MAG TPA: hypothetical protein HA250_04540 [Nanoarchaeota archaeon]|nr:hypothetical protein [Nanoarchaeota archaeon]
METLESMLTPEETLGAEKFFQRLGEADLRNVQKVLSAVDRTVKEYFGANELNYSTIPYLISYYGTLGTPFFAAYLIGGWLNKEAERPDIDLMIATNARYTHGFSNPLWGRNPENWEPMLRELNKEFEYGEELTMGGELPNDYNIGATKGKVMFNVHPGEGRDLDLVYVRSFRDYSAGRMDSCFFLSEEEFITRRDVDGDGKPLARLPLYRNSQNIVPVRGSQRQFHTGDYV